MQINIKNLQKKYKDLPLYDGFNLALSAGKVTTILGASGSGKTTLLHCIAGISPFEGNIDVNGDVSYIFQNDRLISGLTVRRNLAYVLQQKIPDKALRDAHIDEYLGLVSLSDAGDKYPHQLSGGMRQRAAMARAFSYPSQILLMDEPFKSLDIALKNQLLKLFLNLLDKQPRSVVFVTHDINEAILCSDRIVVIGNIPVNILYDRILTEDKHDREKLLLSGHYMQTVKDITDILTLQL